ncbi:oligoendopeptidase F [Treponema sp.]|uniref:oligoendopeptidase F n=1 Tax=Treponema sp. TaxID=166 RepID=UPI0025EFA729|nr:oligoendopeptidase F [Treponema sp.]MCR5217375.1 oligoendopeptidase F [Treponema sp.]
MADNEIKTRDQIPSEYKWDLTKLYSDEAQWEKELKEIPVLAKKFLTYKGHLGDSAEKLLEALHADEDLDRLVEKVSHYAGLKNSADQGDSKAQEDLNRVMMAYTECSSLTSYFVPELLSLPEEKINEWIKMPGFENYRIYIQKILHAKPHTLSEKEERLLALQSETSDTASNVFSLLSDVDLNFGSVKVDGKDVPITHSTWSSLEENQDRAVRKETYEKFYGVHEGHANTLAALYAGSVKQDIFIARARGYDSALEASLYGDKVPVSVYKNLIETVHKNLPVLHRYYALRKRVLGLKELRHYDVYVPLVKSVKANHSYEEAVEIVRNSLAILGKDYTDTLCSGLLSGWTDRYENKGKRSGAFSSGAYDGYPYILLNYKEDSIRDVFTMAHEGGHSMHSWFSVHNNPFRHYDYTIFEAEVASTFNEELVFEYLLNNADSDDMKKYLLSMRASDILATLHRQTMFAEFELKCHEMVEKGEPLSTDSIRAVYRKLLEEYFGPDMVFEKSSDLEGLRIPHFYNAFYVYKYATGISAALALAKRVTEGGEKELNDYFNFLKSGGSRYPIEALKVGGVDMSSTKPVQDALDTFAGLVDKLEKLL